MIPVSMALLCYPGFKESQAGLNAVANLINWICLDDAIPLHLCIRE